jgi:hypothetical protein
LPEGFKEGGASGRGAGSQVTYPRDLRRLLRADGERRRQEGKGKIGKNNRPRRPSATPTRAAWARPQTRWMGIAASEEGWTDIVVGTLLRRRPAVKQR